MDYLKLILDKETELAPMFKRMDADAQVLNLAAYEFRGTDKKPLNRAYSVTMPDAKQFLDDATSKLVAVTRQVVIEGDKMAPNKTSVIEAWLDAVDHAADNLLERQGKPPLYLQHAKRVNYRGSIVSQVMFKIVDGQLLTDVRSLDSRWFPCELTKDGMEWGCSRTYRSKEDILKEYPGANVKGKNGIVRDFWNKDYNFVYVDDKQVYEEINPYGRPPFNIAFANVMDAETLNANDYYERLGDSLLHSLRNADGATLFDENNYIASYLKTMSVDDLRPAVAYPSTEDKAYQKLPDATPGTGEMVPVKQPPVLYPRGQLSQAMAMFIERVDAAKQRGTFATLASDIMLPQSGVAIAQKVALQGETLLPRLNCLASICQQTALMEIEQFILLGESVEIGERGHSRRYSPVDLAGDYTVKYKFFTNSVEQMSSGAAMCQTLGDLAPRSFKMGEIMKFQDPSGMEEEIQMEQAAKANPVIDLKNKMVSFLRARDKTGDKELKAIYNSMALDLIEQIESIYRQRKASENEPANTDMEQSAKVETKGTPGIPKMFGG